MWKKVGIHKNGGNMPKQNFMRNLEHFYQSSLLMKMPNAEDL